MLAVVAVTSAKIDIGAFTCMNGHVSETGNLLVGRDKAHIGKQRKCGDRRERIGLNRNVPLMDQSIFVGVVATDQPVEDPWTRGSKAQFLSKLLYVSVLAQIEFVGSTKNCFKQGTQIDGSVYALGLLLRTVAARRCQTGGP